MNAAPNRRCFCGRQYPEVECTCGRQPRAIKEKKEQQITEDLLKLFESGDMSDFTIKSHGREFHVHKAILFARSDYFAALIKSNLEETKSSIAEISDVDPEVLEVVLRYLYSGRSPTLNAENVFAILVAADRFMVDNLKGIVAETLSKLLKPRNAAHFLIFAERFGLIQLKYQALNALGHTGPEFLDSPEWTELLTKHPMLVSEFVRGLLMRREVHDRRRFRRRVEQIANDDNNDEEGNDSAPDGGVAMEADGAGQPSTSAAATSQNPPSPPYGIPQTVWNTVMKDLKRLQETGKHWDGNQFLF